MEPLDSAVEFFTQLTPVQIGVAIVAFAFLLIGLRLIFKKPPAHLTAFSGDAGSVLVSRKALQELVRSACLLDEWVEAARPVIRVKNNKVTALVELRLTRPDNLKAVCERVQEHITALLQKSLSFDQIGEIQIVVKSFSNEAADLPDPADSEPEATSQLLSGNSSVNLPPADAEEEKQTPKA
ncbi:hypothetical protein [Pelagicoccus mobilis]|uniref:Alkaline shock response membrane anchor protein AmaP n=1 Tax=Pelagicoccus mobilis TaxID=415221 RepID=A0A934VQ35_9BACT|nr:hypothetical protein [Pelagicoccus mobilis]MBK1877927.1 hypothetical protein [Pelagicoccus mobilis]